MGRAKNRTDALTVMWGMFSPLTPNNIPSYGNTLASSQTITVP